MIKDFDITKTKLIIWDMDETFWQGTLSEGKINFVQENLRLLEELNTKGIMNSICSKNDYFDVKTQFFTNGYRNYWYMFLFPSIDWTAKGLRVKSIIDTMQLRDENVIVIDDNISNINEIKYYCPNIMSAMPEQIKKIAQELYLVNTYDFELTRLKSYKILEAKNKDKLITNCSNEEFLRNSNIRICIKKDCLENIDRIDTLIHRTNQLNFTKKRIDKDILKNLLANTTKYDSAYIIAEDNYGNYGICGFYSIDKEKKELEHFLFSCRIMNMGIEQFLYKKLGCPNLEIAPTVSSDLKQKSDWVKIDNNIEIKKHQITDDTKLNILFKGACDLYSSISYINGNCNIDTEFPYWNRDLIYISSHTHLAFIEQTNRLSEEEIKYLNSEFPFPHPDEFKTDFFNPKYNVIVLSLLQTVYRGLYINKNTGYYAEYGYANCDITDEKNWDKVLSSIPENFKDENKKILMKFKNEYTFAGNPPVDLTLQNLKYIREHLNPKTELILILGSEIDTKKVLDGYENIASKYKIINKYIREFAKKYNNTDIIDITNFIKSDNDYAECINHFARKIYAELSEKIIDIVNNRFKENILFFNNK